jgi:hypothetical protein
MLEHIHHSHVPVQCAMEIYLRYEFNLNIFSSDFICRGGIDLFKRKISIIWATEIKFFRRTTGKTRGYRFWNEVRNSGSTDKLKENL